MLVCRVVERILFFWRYGAALMGMFRGSVVITSSGIRISFSLVPHTLIWCVVRVFDGNTNAATEYQLIGQFILEGRRADEVCLKLLQNELF